MATILHAPDHRCQANDLHPVEGCGVYLDDQRKREERERVRGKPQ